MSVVDVWGSADCYRAIAASYFGCIFDDAMNSERDMELITREELVGLLKALKGFDEDLNMYGVHVAPNWDESLGQRIDKAIAALQAAEPTSWMTRHDEPMLFLCEKEAANYCDDDERPIPLFTLPCPPAKALSEMQITYLLDLAAEECDGLASEWDSDDVVTDKNYAQACADRIRALDIPQDLLNPQPAKAQADLVWCGCGDGYPADSYGAAFIDIFGHCENCHMGSETADPAAQVESWAGGFRINPMGNIERLRDGMFLYSCPNLPYEAQGWKLVPIEPTPDMTLQGALAGVEHGNGEFSQVGAEAAYKAMLTASPAKAQGEITEVLKEMRARKINHGKNTSPTLEAWADRIEAALPAKAQVPEEIAPKDSPAHLWTPEARSGWAMGWNACRKAMLAASPAPGESANWNDVGERCLDCGDKDWFAGTVCEGKQEEAER